MTENQIEIEPNELWNNN